MTSQTRLIMGMPITINIVSNKSSNDRIFETAFDFFTYTDKTFSTYKSSSEISRINSSELKLDEASKDVHAVLKQCQYFSLLTGGYFDATRNNKLDPSGLVKGWSVAKVGRILDKAGAHDYFIDAGGDILAKGLSAKGSLWKVGIRHPFITDKFSKILRVTDLAVATSATYERGNHIYNPKTGKPATFLASVTVVGPDICVADVFATALFAAEADYVTLIPQIPSGYQVFVIHRRDKLAFSTPGFDVLTAA